MEHNRTEKENMSRNVFTDVWMVPRGDQSYQSGSLSCIHEDDAVVTMPEGILLLSFLHRFDCTHANLCTNLSRCKHSRFGGIVDPLSGESLESVCAVCWVVHCVHSVTQGKEWLLELGLVKEKEQDLHVHHKLYMKWGYCAKENCNISRD